MKYPTQSAVQNYYLQSILPNAFIFEQKQIPKNKDFYQPQKCIWNIPHRVSSRMYPYYHKFNDDYTTLKQPIIKKLQQHDRKYRQDQRIISLIQKRYQARNIFYNRKQKRIDLQEKSKSHINSYSSCKSKIPEKQSNIQLIKLQNQRTLSQKKYIKINSQQNQHRSLSDRKSQRIRHLEENYQSAVLKSLKKQNQIKNLINQQRKLNHDRIKEQFDLRRYKNKNIMSKLIKVKRNVSYKV